MLAHTGHLADVKKLVSLMSEEASPNVWKALLGGCHLYSDIKLVEQLDAKEDYTYIILISFKSFMY